MILASCTVNDLTPELLSGKVKSGGEKVVLNVEVDYRGKSENDNADSESMISVLNRSLLSLKNQIVMCVTIIIDGSEEIESFPVIAEENSGNVFVKFDRENFESIQPNIQKIKEKGYIPLCTYKEGYSNMRDVYDISVTEGVRVLGGNFLEISGILIGRYENKGKTKANGVYNGIYDSFVEMRLSDLQNLEVVKSKLKKLKSTVDSDEEKPKKKAKQEKSKLAERFRSLFSEEVDF